jgi:heme/copper-type cytochrome/quinol oxidase subunit 2
MKKYPDRNKALVLFIPALIAVIAIASSVIGCTEEEAAATGITAIAGFAGLYICIIAVAWLVGIFLFVVWIIMLVDCAQRDNANFPDANSNSKLMWILIIVLAGGIGAIIYYFVVMRKVPRKKQITQ